MAAVMGILDNIFGRKKKNITPDKSSYELKNQDEMISHENHQISMSVEEQNISEKSKRHKEGNVLVSDGTAVSHGAKREDSLTDDVESTGTKLKAQEEKPSGGNGAKPSASSDSKVESKQERPISIAAPISVKADITHCEMDLSTFLDKGKEIHQGYFIAAMTDKYVVGNWDADNRSPEVICKSIVADKLLELRIFDQIPECVGDEIRDEKSTEGNRCGREYKLFRSDVSPQKKFICRTIIEGETGRTIDAFDEWQYLDIDTEISGRETTGMEAVVSKDCRKKKDGPKEGSLVTTTGGGAFDFPRILREETSMKKPGKPIATGHGSETANPDHARSIGQNARIGIRYYIGQYAETGQARVEEWRVIGFRND